MIDDYGDLKSTVADWLDREDLTSVIPTFIRLAETDIYRDLRCRENEFVVTYDATGWTIAGHSSVADTDGAFLTLPPNFKEMKKVTWEGRPLAEISPQQLAARGWRPTDFMPNAFAIEGRDIEFIQALETDQTEWGESTLVYTYYGTESLDASPTWQVADNPTETPPVSDSDPQGNAQDDSNTTRLLQVAPDLYLYGALYQAGLYLKSTDLVQTYGTLFRSALGALRRESRLSTFSGSTVAVTNGR